MFKKIFRFLFRSHKTPPSPEETLLLRICHGDKDRMERLISYEVDKNSGLSRHEAVRNAVYALQRDNR
ncbi:MAG: hypothetical protein Q3M24_15180 [Candidatus Electrothrix aestuarii]|uniref:Uncharacterized protein n=1 Tax=Candidatus Electrothrix aestuarii TaxID=3062594 RepID=A0AAU8LQY9_9BACT|nr:hypothetical protein [Candidatus Electrothrix aestuarii]